jgi:hypothetical protein
MATREKVTSAFAPDLDEVRAWLQKMIAALRFVDLVTAVIALIVRMRDLNTELVAQLAHLRRARPRAEALRRLERQLVLPLEGLTAPSAAKPSNETTPDDDTKKRRRRHPGRGAPPAHLPHTRDGRHTIQVNSCHGRATAGWSKRATAAEGQAGETSACLSSDEVTPMHSQRRSESGCPSARELLGELLAG